MRVKKPNKTSGALFVSGFFSVIEPGDEEVGCFTQPNSDYAKGIGICKKLLSENSTTFESVPEMDVKKGKDKKPELTKSQHSHDIDDTWDSEQDKEEEETVRPTGLLAKILYSNKSDCWDSQEDENANAVKSSVEYADKSVGDDTYRVDQVHKHTQCKGAVLHSGAEQDKDKEERINKTQEVNDNERNDEENKAAESQDVYGDKSEDNLVDQGQEHIEHPDNVSDKESLNKMDTTDSTESSSDETTETETSSDTTETTAQQETTTTELSPLTETTQSPESRSTDLQDQQAPSDFEYTENSAVFDRKQWMDVKQEKAAKCQDIQSTDAVLDSVDEQNRDKEESINKPRLKVPCKRKHLSRDHRDSDSYLSGEEEMFNKTYTRTAQQQVPSNYVNTESYGYRESQQEIGVKEDEEEAVNSQESICDDTKSFPVVEDHEEEEPFKKPKLSGGFKDSNYFVYFDSHLAIDFHRQGKDEHEDSEGTKSQDEPGHGSFCKEPIQGTDGAMGSEAKQVKEEERPSKQFGELTCSHGHNTKSPNQQTHVFMDCHTCVCPDNQHACLAVHVKVKDEGNVAAKSRDKEEPSKAHGEKALSGEISSKSPKKSELPDKQLLGEVLESSNSASELDSDCKEGEDNDTETSKSQDDSVHDPSSDDVQVDQEHERFQRADAVEDMEAKEDMAKDGPIQNLGDLFISGFLSVISTRQEESVSHTPPNPLLKRILGPFLESSNSASELESDDKDGEDNDTEASNCQDDSVEDPSSDNGHERLKRNVEDLKTKLGKDKKELIQTLTGLRDRDADPTEMAGMQEVLGQDKVDENLVKTPRLFVDIPDWETGLERDFKDEDDFEKPHTSKSLHDCGRYYSGEILSSVQVDQLFEHSQCTASGVSDVNQDEEQPIKTPGSQPHTFGAPTVATDELPRYPCHPPLLIKVQTELLLGHGRMHFCQEALKKQEDGKEDNLNSEKKARMCLLQEKLQREEQEEEEQLVKEKEKRIRLRQQELKKEEEREMELLKREKEKRTHLLRERLKREEEEEAQQLMMAKGKRICVLQERLGEEKDEKLKTLYDENLRRIDGSKTLNTYIETRAHRRQEEEDKEEQLKSDQEELSTEEENDAEEIKREKKSRAHIFQEEFSSEEEEEDEMLKKDKDIQSQEQLSSEEEEVGQLKVEKERRTSFCLEKLETEEEVARLKRDIFKRKSLLLAELCADFKKELQLRIQFSHDELIREEEEELEKLKREKERRTHQQKEKLLREEEDEVAQLKKEKERRICCCRKVLRRHEEVEVEQLKQEKETRMRHHLQQLDREEESFLKNDKHMRKNLQKEPSRLAEEAERSNRQKDLTGLRQQLHPKKEEEEDEQLSNATTTWLWQEELRREEEEDERRNFNLRRDRLLREEDLDLLNKEKDRRMSLYQERLRREEEEELEFLKRESVAKVHYHKEALNREEEKEIKQLKTEKEERIRVFQEELRREEANERERLKRVRERKSSPGREEKGNKQLTREETKLKPHGMDPGIEEEEAMRLMREEMLCHEDSRREEEEELEVLKMDIIRRWLQQEKGGEKLEQDVFKKEVKARTQLIQDGLSKEDEGLKRENEKIMYSWQKELSSEEEEEPVDLKWEGEKKRSLLPQEAVLLIKKEEITEQLPTAKTCGTHFRQELKEEMDEANRFNKKKEKGIYHWPQELEGEDEEQVARDVKVLAREKEIIIHSGSEELKREEVKQSEREQKSRLCIHLEELRREEKNEADELKKEKEKRIRRLLEELREEEEEEAERLKKDKEKRMRLLREQLRREEQGERLKRENERRIRLQQEELIGQEEEEWYRMDKEEQMRLYLEKLRKEEEETGEQLKIKKEKTMQNYHEELRREERMQVEQLQKEKEKRIGLLLEELKRQDEQQCKKEKENKLHDCREMLLKEENDAVEIFKREKEKRINCCQEELKREEEEEEERLNKEKENRIRLLQDKLKEETEELMVRLNNEKEHRMRLRQIDQKGENDEKKLKTEYKERLRSLRQCILAKKREEEELLNKLSGQKELRHSVLKDREEKEIRLREDRENVLREICLALEEERLVKHGMIKGQRRPYFEDLRSESDEELQVLKTRLREERKEGLKFLSQEAREIMLGPSFCSSFDPLGGTALGSQHHILGGLGPIHVNTSHFSSLNPTLSLALSMPASANCLAYRPMHPSLSTPEHLPGPVRTAACMDPLISAPYIANPLGYCDQLSLNNFNEITVHRFQKQSANWIPFLSI
ncbi:trichohyalin-like isoform X2 [Nerophis ophidion]|uniref:trichohyalin-like isoform X2 n=1 Tax=Nerophis ophidion TaxID=159077 RepID=UPI002ADF8E8F|nr:trichohyalin-like isoform X2 [Nerophis ophidion]